MPDRRQRALIILFSIAALVLILLAAGIGGVPFDAGRAFQEEAPLVGVSYTPRALNYNLLLVFYIFLLGAALLALYLHREARRRSLILLALAGIVGLFLYRFIDQIVYAPPVEPTPALPLSTVAPTAALPTTAPLIIEEDLPLDTPDWLVTAIGAALAFLLAGALGLIYLAFGQRTPRHTLQDALAKEAEQAAAALQEGEAIRDVILRCYHEMERCLMAERNLPRNSAVTAREFERSLVRLGFPQVPVHTLTRLFEAVRYGRLEANEEQTQQAVDSLQVIAAHVQKLGEP